jgi:hypothetical protein
MAVPQNIVTEDVAVQVSHDDLLRLAERNSARLGMSLQEAYELYSNGGSAQGYVWDDLSMIFMTLELGA